MICSIERDDIVSFNTTNTNLSTHSPAVRQMPPRASSDGVSRDLGSEPRSLIASQQYAKIPDPNARRSRAGGGEGGGGFGFLLFD